MRARVSEWRHTRNKMASGRSTPVELRRFIWNIRRYITGISLKYPGKMVNPSSHLLNKVLVTHLPRFYKIFTSNMTPGDNTVFQMLTANSDMSSRIVKYSNGDICKVPLALYDEKLVELEHEWPLALQINGSWPSYLTLVLTLTFWVTMPCVTW